MQLRADPEAPPESFAANVARPSGYVAFVLHAHLPYVRHPEHPRSIEERWLFEAMWQTYLPLLQIFDRFETEGILAPISISVSPPLMAMWRDPLLRLRFVDHVHRTRTIAQRALEKAFLGSAFEAPLQHFHKLLAASLTTFERHGGDILSGFLRHHRAGRLHLFTTTATHAFLPGLAPTKGWACAQVALGKAAFHAETSIASDGLWLPECSYSKDVGDALGAENVAFSVLDAHGLSLATPQPKTLFIGLEDPLKNGAKSIDFVVPIEPLLAANNVAYFGRDLWAGRSVWAMDGYPSHPAYCELHRDLGFDASPDDLCGEIGPNGTRLATGLRLFRISGAGIEKAPYDPLLAERQAQHHAAVFVNDRRLFFNAITSRDQEASVLFSDSPVASSPSAPPLSVVPFDAELFGHFWHEGPTFLENVLRILHNGPPDGPKAIALPDYLKRYPPSARGEPEPSTWGEGGFGATWTGPRTASLWRHVHHVSALVERAVRKAPHCNGPSGEALDQAIVEALLLQSSDFAFMIHRNTTAAYAWERATQHASRAGRLAELSMKNELSPKEVAWIVALRGQTPFLRNLPSHVIRAPFLRD